MCSTTAGPTIRISDTFVQRFADFSRAFAEVVSRETEGLLRSSPSNEISFFAWAGGDMGIFNPFATRRGDELKEQLLRATIAAIRSMWEGSKIRRGQRGCVTWAYEVRRAMRESVPVSGLCLYPIVNHPGWDDDRHCHNGLWDYPDENGAREI